jgi:hypothetical protein
MYAKVDAKADCTGGSAAFEERTKGSLTVRLSVDGNTIFKKDFPNNALAVQWDLSAP